MALFPCILVLSIQFVTALQNWKNLTENTTTENILYPHFKTTSPDQSHYNQGIIPTQDHTNSRVASNKSQGIIPTQDHTNIRVASNKSQLAIINASENHLLPVTNTQSSFNLSITISTNLKVEVTTPAVSSNLETKNTRHNVSKTSSRPACILTVVEERRTSQGYTEDIICEKSTPYGTVRDTPRLLNQHCTNYSEELKIKGGKRYLVPNVDSENCVVLNKTFLPICLSFVFQDRLQYSFCHLPFDLIVYLSDFLMQLNIKIIEYCIGWVAAERVFLRDVFIEAFRGQKECERPDKPLLHIHPAPVQLLVCGTYLTDTNWTRSTLLPKIHMWKSDTCTINIKIPNIYQHAAAKQNQLSKCAFSNYKFFFLIEYIPVEQCNASLRYVMVCEVYITVRLTVTSVTGESRACWLGVLPHSVNPGIPENLQKLCPRRPGTKGHQVLFLSTSAKSSDDCYREMLAGAAINASSQIDLYNRQGSFISISILGTFCLLMNLGSIMVLIQGKFMKHSIHVYFFSRCFADIINVICGIAREIIIYIGAHGMLPASSRLDLLVAFSSQLCQIWSSLLTLAATVDR